MATIHYVQLAQYPVDPVTGNIIVKNTASIKAMMTNNTEWRVIPKASVPNSSTTPTIDAYLALEAADGMLVGHMDTYNLITQKT